MLELFVNAIMKIAEYGGGLPSFNFTFEPEVPQQLQDKIINK